DDVVALLGEVLEHALRLGGLGHVLGIGGFDLPLELLFQHLAAIVVGVGPALVVDGAQVDEGSLDDLVARGRGGGGGRRRRGRLGGRRSRGCRGLRCGGGGRGGRGAGWLGGGGRRRRGG